MEVFKDFDKFIIQKRIAKLAGREFDVSKISTRMSLKQAEYRDKALLMGEKESLRGHQNSCKISVTQPEIFFEGFNLRNNAKRLIENTNFEQLIAFIDFVLEPITGKKEEEKGQEEEKKK